jgi:PAS domain S-box-containing protein
VKDSDKSKGQLIDELTMLREQVARLRERLRLPEMAAPAGATDSTPGDASPSSRERQNGELEKATALDSITEIVVCQDAEMRVLWANSVAGESVGLSPEELVGRRCYEVWHQRDEPCADCPVVSARETGLPQEAEITTPDGREWLIRGYPIRDTDGNIKSIIELALDISERKQIEQALTRERNLLRTLIDSLPDNIYAKDPEGRFLLNNATSMRLLGATSQEELLGKTDFDFMPADRAARYRAIEQAFLRSGQSIAEQEVFYPDRKERQWISTSSIPLRNDDGKVFGFVGIGRDISRQKQMQQALLKASRMEAAATLAGGNAQNVNNLMTAVLGYAELLQLDLADRPEALKVLATIADSARQASELAQQMLAYAQVSHHWPRTINLNDTVQNVLRAQERSIPSSVQVDLELAPDLWDVEADQTQMSQAILYLFTNALEAIQDSGRVTIATKNASLARGEIAGLAPGPYVRLSVQDTGCGMSQEVRDRIFEPFFTTKFPGRGMGLAAAHGTVTLHGGHISVESQEGHGATFTVHLPAVQAPAEADAYPLTTSPTPKRAEETEPGPATVLLIEEDELVLRVTQRMVEQLGYRVLVAHGEKPAVETVRALGRQIDLVLLDLDMPGLSGQEMLSTLIQARPQVRVILYSAYDPDKAVQALLDAGAHAFVRMPFGMEAIETALGEALGKPPGAKPLD